jgi:hypothetical protein
MKRVIQYPFLLALIVIWSNSFGQGKVALEQIQVYSTTQPKLTYWHLPNDITAIEKALDTGLFAKLNLQRSSLQTTERKILSKQNQVGKITINWEATRDVPFHAYLELYELDPIAAYQNKLVDISEEKKDSIHSLWAIACNIFNQKHERLLQKTIVLGMIPVQALGMGYPITSVATTPTAQYQALVKAIGMLSPTTDDMDFIEAKVPAAYATDNYWMPIIHNQPRTLFDTSKQFVSYANASGLQLLRIVPASLNKIELKNKNDNYPFKQVVANIKKYRIGTSSKEYYQVIQPLRDVHANKDYTLEAYLEFNPDVAESGSFIKQQALLFIPEFTHNIYEGKDSIGQFNVKELVQEKDKFYFADQIYNGYDSTKKYNIGTSYGPEAIIHSKVIEGNVYNHNFKIEFSVLQQQKTILVDNKILMIIEGTNKPHQMVSVPSDISNNFKNLLLLIAYGELFQSPN